MTGSLTRAAITSAFSLARSAAEQEPPTILNGFLTSDGGFPSKMKQRQNKRCVEVDKVNWTETILTVPSDCKSGID